MTEFDLEQAHETLAEQLSLAADCDCVMASRGAGDGGYPVYWGVDANGLAASLQVDFLPF